MANVTISCFSGDGPRATVIVCPDGQAFISLEVSDGVTLYVEGFDGVALASARAVAAALTKAADELEARLGVTPAAARL